MPTAKIPVNVGESCNKALLGFAEARKCSVGFLVLVLIEEYFKEEDPGNLPIVAWENSITHLVELPDELKEKIIALSKSECMPLDLALQGIVENRILDRQKD